MKRKSNKQSVREIDKKRSVNNSENQRWALWTH